MIRKSALLLCVLSLTAFTAAGCGDDDKKSDSTSTPATPAATTDAGSTDSGSTDSGSTDAPSGAVQAAIDQCKKTIDSTPGVKEEIKPDLQEICEKAASGDANAAREASKEVCLKIVESSGLPDSALDTAKQACETAGG